MPDRLIDRAPAKINLTLHVLGRRADGYHQLESLVAFSRSGDTLALEPGPELGLTVDGPGAEAAGPGADNLVLKAARALAARVEGLQAGTFALTKRLPVAAGIGGGSSDAAAALRLLARLNGLAPEDDRVMDAARATGADVPVCVGATARMMRGIGETLGEPLRLPPLPALIVNPAQPLETRAVFARMGLAADGRMGAGAHPDVDGARDARAVQEILKRGRNDMEDAACVLAPVIGAVLSILSAAPGCRLARMSGSGATCYGLFADCRAAGRARTTILRAHPNWWVKRCILN